MDPELYVFPAIRKASIKILASSSLFLVIYLVLRLLDPFLAGPHMWTGSTWILKIGSSSLNWMHILGLLLGFGLFIYGAYHAWRATQLKNTYRFEKLMMRNPLQESAADYVIQLLSDD